jgi:hypothetical protein
MTLLEEKDRVMGYINSNSILTFSIIFYSRVVRIEHIDKLVREFGREALQPSKRPVQRL